MKLSKYSIFFLMVLVNIHQCLSQEGEWSGIVEPQGMGCPICHKYENYGQKALNCLVETEEDEKPRVLINKTAIAKLRELCGDTLDGYGEEEGGGYKLCCHEEHITELAKQISMAQGIIQRCPSCWKNFRQVFCELACSPYQKHFLRADRVEDTPIPEGEDKPKRPRMIRELGLYCGTYESCKDFVFGEDNTPAMDFLCGRHGSLRCTPEHFYGYMGDISNGYAPMRVNFRYKDENNEEDGNVTAFDGVTLPCHEAWDGDQPCSCMHSLDNEHRSSLDSIL